MDNISRYIQCPGCLLKCFEKDVKFKQVKNKMLFKMTCLHCGHQWEAQASDFKEDRSTDPRRNPFNPINITPRF